MADTAPANGNGNGAGLMDTTKANAAGVLDSVKSGPVAQMTKDQAAKTGDEFINLANSRKTPANPAATGQPLTHYHSFFFELLGWNNPRASAIGYVTIVSLIFAVRYLDVIRWFFKLTWMVLGTTVAAELVGKLVLGNGLASQVRPRKYYVVPRETLDALIGDVHELINFFVIESQRILFAENVGASAAAFVAAFLSYYLVKIVPYWGLAIIATTAAFFIPLIYTSNQELIDTQIKNASEIVNAQTQQVRSIASQHTQQVADLTKQYMGDYSAKAQQMIRGRSASPEVSAQPAKTADPDLSDIPSVPTENPVRKEESQPPIKEEDSTAQPAM